MVSVQVDSTRSISEYDEETQAGIHKIMFDQEQKRKVQDVSCRWESVGRAGVAGRICPKFGIMWCHGIQGSACATMNNNSSASSCVTL